MLGFGARLGSQIARDPRHPYRRRARAAAAEGRLREVPASARAPRQDPARRSNAGRGAPERPLLLHRARALSEQLAEALGGIPAGDAAPLARGVDPARDRRRRRRARTGARRFAALPEIVTLAAPRPRRHARGRPRRARPRAARDARHGAPPRHRLGGVRRLARPAARGARRADASTALLGLPYLPPELRELPRAGRAAGARRARQTPRRPPLPHRLVGRQGDRARDGRGRTRAAATTTSRSATTRAACASCRA